MQAPKLLGGGELRRRVGDLPEPQVLDYWLRRVSVRVGQIA